MRDFYDFENFIAVHRQKLCRRESVMSQCQKVWPGLENWLSRESTCLASIEDMNVILRNCIFKSQV